MGLITRIQKLEVVAAPIKAEQARKRQNAELRAEILNHLKDHIEDILSSSRYVHGADLDEPEVTKDIIELNLLFHAEAMDRFGVDESGSYKATPEQLSEVNREMAMLMNRDYFGCYETAEQFDKTQERWIQARTDMENGVDSAQSKAAEYLRQRRRRYPSALET
jgi:predicted ribosome quality control (RQC) complex YloA/Tae2 family protein